MWFSRFFDRAAGHSIFRQFAPYEGWAEAGFERGFYGVNIRDWLHTGQSKGFDARRAVYVEHPSLNEEYFEWIALLATIANARRRYCFAEIGAGWGRWMAAAVVLCRQKGIECSLIGVEAESSHFDWMKMVLRDNGVNPDDHTLLQGAAADADGEVILTGPDAPRTVWGHRTVRPEDLASWQSLPDYVFWRVPGYSLDTIFANHQHIDLVDIDIQGVEYDILAPAFDTLNAKVSVVHVGTHSRAIEKALNTVFRRNRWHNAYSFACHRESRTPFGRASFVDGVQTWVNPKRMDLLAALRNK